MALNINLIVILLLTFFAGNGSLLLIRQAPGCVLSECERPDAKRSFAKRSADSYGGSNLAEAVEWSPVPYENVVLPLRGEFRTRFKAERTSPFKYLLPWRKRNELEFHDGRGHTEKKHHFPTTAETEIFTHRLTSQFIFRVPRPRRLYDVPQIECPQAKDGMDRFACPSPDRTGRYRCIDDHLLCDGFIDCPSGEDEDRQGCLFYKTVKAHLDVLADGVLRWAKGR